MLIYRISKPDGVVPDQTARMLSELGFMLFTCTYVHLQILIHIGLLNPTKMEKIYIFFTSFKFLKKYRVYIITNEGDGTTL